MAEGLAFQDILVTVKECGALEFIVNKEQKAFCKCRIHRAQVSVQTPKANTQSVYRRRAIPAQRPQPSREDTTFLSS